MVGGEQWKTSKGREAVENYLETHDEGEFVTTALNIKEIAVGREIQGKLDPFEIHAKFEWMTIIPFRPEHAFVAGELEAELHQNEHINKDKINSLAGDVLIAAVAKETGATVVTQNTDDFQTHSRKATKKLPDNSRIKSGRQLFPSTQRVMRFDAPANLMSSQIIPSNSIKSASPRRTTSTRARVVDPII
ncbi:PIN domain-containing protein [Halostagnicola sp. A56]|uniref:PIN domain-containing protein n=1 Tax=Halostagnicola sp. A56 TaxID=1495067 RepID=UPI001E47E9E2|nr:PIN domain-containing protein [Halostagnicola sp. A56]